jgi:hypothetical protein
MEYVHGKIKLFACIFLILLIGCYDKKNGFELSDIHLKEGDIVFRKGLSTKSNAVLHADKDGIYSHVGIIVKPEFNSGFMVIHVTPGEREKGEKEDRIKMETLAQFFSPQKAEHGAIFRLTDSFEYAEKATQESYRLYQKGILFDHDYNLEDSTEMYCTELIWHAYLSGGKDITSGRRNEIANVPIYSGTYIFPSDILKEDALTLIYQF